MKKYILCLICSALVMGVCAQKKKEINRKKAPDEVVRTVREKSKGALIEKWYVKGEKYYAVFHPKDGKCTITVGSDGKWKKTETKINLVSVPINIRKYLLDHHPKYILSKADRVDKPDQSYYKLRIESEKDKMKLKFTLKGQLIPEEKEKNGNPVNE